MIFVTCPISDQWAFVCNFSLFLCTEALLPEDVAAAILDCSDDEECDIVVIPPDNDCNSDEEAVDEENLDTDTNDICGTVYL